MRRVVTLFVVPVLGIGGLLVEPAAATDTWTRITGPRGPGHAIFQFVNIVTNPNPTMTVSGTTSADVATVNIYCLYDYDSRTTSNNPLNSAPIAVTDGVFSASGVATPRPFAAPPNVPCILRAVPGTYTGIDGAGNNAGYVTSFAGPEFYRGGYRVHEVGPATAVGWEISSIHPRVANQFGNPDDYSIGSLYTVDDAANLAGQTATDGDLGIPFGNVVASPAESTRSALVIDGHSAYFPQRLSNYAVDVADVPEITFSAKRLASGELQISEREPLSYCAGDAYPPTAGACTPVATGVVFVHTLTTSRDGAVTTLRGRFVDVSHTSHSLKLEYLQYVNAYISAGVRMPGSSTFRAYDAGTVLGTPVRASTIFLTSDSRAADGDPNRADTGITYSGHPKVFFADPSVFAMRYTRTIPKNGFAGLAFAVETGVIMDAVTTWAAERQRALREHLRVTAPKSPTSADPVAVKGRVTNPVNGYPGKVKVTVAGKSKKVKVSADGRWVAKFSLPPGRYTAHVRATDPSGIVLTARRTFKVT